MQTVDVQVNDVIRQLNDIKLLPAPTPSKNKLFHDAIMRTVKDISVEGAVAILRAFNYDRDTLYMKSMKWQACDLMNEEYFPEHQGRLAKDTCIFWFWGGPPNKLAYWQGTLQTLLKDRILCEINEHGVERIAMLIGLDDASNN